jgi:2,4-dienoyl-CoA reductase-like NADH-dependent reductase (Old Yellow Enzyme family)/NADPH-dependent 2,4-dienoyl-CoA reductase/sulfur reductase-like enzyme
LPAVPGFDHVLRPGRLGPLELRNRIVLPAMDMNLCDDGMITDGEIAHYARRAEGGAALLITGSGAVAYPVGAASRRQPGLSDDRFVPGLARLADAVHRAGSRLCVQLTHHGKTARIDIADGRPLLVPSDPSEPLDLSALRDNTAEELAGLAAATGGRRPTYRVADEDDLAWVIGAFAAGARRAAAAGADAVEVHAAHGYVISTFLAAADNHRTDRWGGPIEHRARLGVQVIEAVRSAVGPAVAVLVRLSGQEFGGAGALTAEEAVRAAQLFEQAGADAVHVTGWGRNSFSNFTDGPLPDTEAAYRDHARAVRSAVSIPVIAVGRILPEMAEAMLAAGDCDFVAMGRQLLADPDLPVKLASGRRRSVRPCINCYVCVERNFFDETPRCAVNPALADETVATFAPAERPGHVVVVGGGPAGMESARIAAERGHRVTLLDAADHLGGTAWFSQLTTPANGPLVDWLVHELDRLGVEVRLRTRATPAVVSALDPDAVLVATGAVRGRPPVPGADLPHVLTGDDLRALLTGGRAAARQPLRIRAPVRLARLLRLTGDAARLRRWSRRWLPLGRRVVVVGGGLVGLELASFVADRGRTVTVLEPGPALGLPMASPRRWTAVRHAEDAAVSLVRGARLLEITAGEVVYEVDGGGVDSDERRVPADTIVIAAEVAAGSHLAEELGHLGLIVHVVGDAAEVAYLDGAIHSAWRAARQL